MIATKHAIIITAAEHDYKKIQGPFVFSRNQPTYTNISKMAQTQHGTTVTYEIFVAESSLGEVGGSGPVALACYLQQQVEARWVRQVHGGCYVWHRDRFDIKALSSGKTNTGSMKNVGGGGDGDGWIVLGGTSYVGDAMQDEWFIVYLLMRISQHLLPDAIIR